MKIELSKEDFVALAVYASCADLPEEENKYEMTIKRVMDNLNEEEAAEIAGDMLALRVKIELLNGTSAEDVLKAVLECVMEKEDEELELDENDGDALKHMEEDNENDD